MFDNFKLGIGSHLLISFHACDALFLINTYIPILLKTSTKIFGITAMTESPMM